MVQGTDGTVGLRGQRQPSTGTSRRQPASTLLLGAREGKGDKERRRRRDQALETEAV